ncbi:MAG: plasmid stability protein y4jJ [Reyranellaceae bacterium]
MADILIRNVSPRTRELLRARAKREQMSLDGYLRDTLERLASVEGRNGRAKVGFGTWLAKISRSNRDELCDVLDRLRSAPLKRIDFD